MSVILTVDPRIKKLEKSLRDYGLKTSIPDSPLDFENDYIAARVLGNTTGMGSVGTIRIHNSPISYLNIIKKQEMAKCDFVAGGYAGMGVHLHFWFKLRFFLSFPNITIGPLNMGTLTNIKKNLFRSMVESYCWNGYQKLTTLPPGLVLDNVGESLDENKTIRQLMTKCLLKERVIRISRYDPQTTKSLRTNSKVVIESHWKLQKDLLLDGDTIQMYVLIAETIKSTIHNLRYHLTDS